MSNTDNGQRPNACSIKFTVLHHAEVEVQYTLSAGKPATFGRDKRANVILNDKDGKMSGCHFEASWNGTQLTIRDKHSTNGTLINGKLCVPDVWMPLNDGDVMSIGSYQYRVTLRLVKDEQKPAAPPAKPAAVKRDPPAAPINFQQFTPPVFNDPIPEPAPEPAPEDNSFAGGNMEQSESYAEEKRKSPLIPILCIVFVLIAALVACYFLVHFDEDATCTEPAKCKLCGREDGDPLGHDWYEATCTEPRTCSRCDETEGSALGHDFAPATCSEPMRCRACGVTEGDPLEHDWADPSCDKPSVCKICGEESGVPTGHQWSVSTCEEPAICSICGERSGEPAGHSWIDATCTTPQTCAVCGKQEGSVSGHTAAAPATCTEASVCSVCGTVLAELAGHAMAPATYEAPSTCTICGETAGEVLGWIGTLKGAEDVQTVKGYQNVKILRLENPILELRRITVSIDVNPHAGAKIYKWVVWAQSVGSKPDEWSQIGAIDVSTVIDPISGMAKKQETFLYGVETTCPRNVTALCVTPAPGTGNVSWEMVQSFTEVQSSVG